MSYGQPPQQQYDMAYQQLPYGQQPPYQPVGYADQAAAYGMQQAPMQVSFVRCVSVQIHGPRAGHSRDRNRNMMRCRQQACVRCSRLSLVFHQCSSLQVPCNTFCRDVIFGCEPQ
jgi:hypothetical protein